ncbi:sensor domain-containing diguanylate cyclase [Pelagerythrobacter rhizovicinus]|uniref:diguanylate cyclase n=1 Tax=Pelagerythrobacter rhizovicinus TaxID=2268576 RepID=A0A4Q2KL76_9SPHN|nr:sensor domain-containing diguanylate cyclase [Pelagerythrobacter rhizovicinus]RXZ64970.1 sensor domain-containing diguanylate cyclase [Pelagerythrobacter rhizovicinus]
MVEDFTLHEGAALYDLLAEGGRNIVLKVDRAGYVVHASAAIGRLGLAIPDMLIAPHLADLAEPAQAEKLRAFLEVVMRGGSATGWFEFAAHMADGSTNWFTLQLRPLLDMDGRASGAIGIMRSLEERRELEERLFTATVTDPLTGLANRRAFQMMLRHLVRRRQGGTLALFDIDHFRAINLRHGASAGDRVLVAFADFLRSTLRHEHIVARIGGESFGVLLPDHDLAAARSTVAAVLAALAEASPPRPSDEPRLSASVGLAALNLSADDTLRRADLALLAAKGRGRGRIEADEDLPDGGRRRA